ncbi:MAG: putative Ig domain-containing protein, partial [Leptospiraceae bacterium]|nr:putative Ig domain-containing protein [Leptospiraceae bacterium]
MKKLLTTIILLNLAFCTTQKDNDGEGYALSTLLYRASKITYSGTAAKGTVKQALVTVSAMDSSGNCSSDIITKTNTDSSGNYTVDYRKTGGVVCVKVLPDPSGKTFMYDEKTSKDISIPANSTFNLTTTLDESKITDTNKRNIPISSITSLLAGRVKSLAGVSSSSSTSKLLKRANKEVVIRMGLSRGLSTRNVRSGVSDENYPELVDISFDLNNGSNSYSKSYLSILAGFSEMANSNKKSTDLSADDVYAAIKAFQDDIADGKFDGKDASGNTITFSTSGTALGDNALSGTLLTSMKNFVSSGGKVGIAGPTVNVSLTELNQMSFLDTADIASSEDYGLPAAPSGFSYNISSTTSSIIFNTGATTVIAPNLAVGTITSCSITPSLPTGLTLGSNCSITGTPSATSTVTSYTITASGPLGSVTTTVSIQINPAAPSISYTPSAMSFTQNSAIATQSASIIKDAGATVSNCVASPTLPMGLSLNTTTCAITGTPSVAQGTTNYTITVTDSFGSTGSTIISINVIDTTAPTPGNSGIISSVITSANGNTAGSVSVSLSWTAGTDNLSNSSNLQYALYYKLDETNSTAIVNSVGGAEAGTLAQGYSSATSATVTGLDPGKSAYWFNVVVKDEVGNKAAYTGKFVNTGIFIVDCDNPATANFGGFSGAITTYCNATNYPSGYQSGQLKCNNSRPFFSTNGFNLKDAPTQNGFSPLLPIYAAKISTSTKTYFATNWATMFNGTFTPPGTMTSLLGITINYWTFSDINGNYDASNNCNDGASESAGLSGTIGDNGFTDSKWLVTTPVAC